MLGYLLFTVVSKYSLSRLDYRKARTWRMTSASTKWIAIASVISGATILLNLGVIVSMVMEMNDFQREIISDMAEFRALSDQTWETILIAAPAAATVRDKRRAGGSCGCSAQPNTCPRGPMGPRGRPGSRGSDGPDGIPGPDAYGVAGLTMTTTGKKACIKCAPGPPGFKGHTGLPGAAGRPGVDGKPGQPGRNGLTGASGPMGVAGVSGRRGAPGVNGQPGRNGVRGNGKPGVVGRIGGRGNHGKPGRSGMIGVPGTPGPAGQPGAAGANGLRGEDGAAGVQGPSGMPGSDAKYCECPPKKDDGVSRFEGAENSEKSYEQPVAASAVVEAYDASPELVKSSSIKNEEPAAPTVTTTFGYTDAVNIGTTTMEQPAPPAAAYGEGPALLETAPPAMEPVLSAAAIAAEVKTEEPVASVTSYDEAAPNEVAASTTAGYEQAVVSVEATTLGYGDAPSTTAPPGFSPRSFEVHRASVVSEESEFFGDVESTPATVAAYDAQPVVTVTPVYHRAAGGGRVAAATTASHQAAMKHQPPEMLMRHSGGWRSRATASPKPAVGAKTVPTHGSNVHLAHKVSGSARVI
ncbi:hypothetical protein PFISCL1PPCAC_8256 [Pristionchus fissidentatus]|uniref:Nematode cuticle collagen N-terminal domain-containing protein n=1 Tax=Pristionchus fissidentatus TaxID=1538716 RepID=A0AAV5VGF5_9BILA|nr:hypothetical protein PFISCL1PPCAC_8256 [Pristionchus fissidentatus]